MDDIIEFRAEERLFVPHQPQPFVRPARFLKPQSALPTISDPPQPKSIENDGVPLQLQLKGWRNPQVLYKTWLVSMSAKHRPIWEKAGIYDAIMSSAHEIRKIDDLLVSLVQNWNPRTQSFVFYWGECSITLEDVHVLGCYSLLGDSVLTPVENEDRAMESLTNAGREIVKSAAKKVSMLKWLKAFMNVDHPHEHEGFLAYWLSVFVFPHAFDSIGKHVLPIAVHLAKGRRIALGPAVLASIYRDLGLVAQKKEEAVGGDMNPITVWAPFQLVQMWIWERFVCLRPKLYRIRPVTPRVARWVVDEKSEVEDVELDLHSEKVGDEFQWRPYASNMNDNVLFSKFYGDRIEGDELKSFARCLRSCDLVGVNCIERYLPHRVAMQFGFDQDVPPDVSGSSANAKTAWRSYTKRIDVTNICIPSPYLTPGVTDRYLEWRKKISSTGETAPSSSETKKSTKRRKVEDDEDQMRLGYLDTGVVPDVPPGFEPKNSKAKKSEESHSRGKKLTGRRRKLDDVISDFALTEGSINRKQLEGNGYYSDEDDIPINELLAYRRKRQSSTVKPNYSMSRPQGTQLESSSIIQDDVVSDLALTDVSINRKQLEGYGYYSDEDDIPINELLAYSRKRQSSTVKPNDGMSRPQGTQLESSSILQIDINVLETEPDICVTGDKQGLVDEAGSSEQQYNSKESEEDVNINENQDIVKCHEQNEKPWMRVERMILLLAREIEMLKVAARARGHNIP